MYQMMNTGCDDHDLKESGEYVVERPRADDRVARFLQTGHPVVIAANTWTGSECRPRSECAS
jgi:hypothetical protein